MSASTDRARLGTLQPAGERWRLRFARELAHPPQRVWAAITEPAHLAAWFPDEIVVERWEAGAPLRFVHPSIEFDGEVLAVRPHSLLEFRWGTDTIRLEIEPTAGGCTLTDTIDELGKAARDGAGWHVCLDALELDLDGRVKPWEDAAHWRDVHPGYVDAFGPAAATIGPPGA
jgi:uncharacterized protein YndB with AHSA1/START domain